MHDTLGLDIAGLCVALQIADQETYARTRETYAEFLSQVAPACTVRVELRPGADFVPRHAGSWDIETALAGDRLSYRSYDDAGDVDFQTGTGLLALAPGAGAENFLRVLYAHLCARSGGLLLHAAGVIRDGRGHVFFGRSGSGKSTTARLSRAAGCTVLSDDLVILRKVEGVFRVFGVPFRGTAMEIPRTRADAPLAGLYALVKAPQHALVPLDRPHAVAALTRSVPFVMAAPLSGNAVIAFCADLARTVHPAELHFRKDDGFWKVIDESSESVSRAA